MNQMGCNLLSTGTGFEQPTHATDVGIELILSPRAEGIPVAAEHIRNRLVNQACVLAASIHSAAA
jgi:hypothetical protein